MGVIGALRIAGSALTAQRLRMDVTSSNIANAETTRSSEGGPYRRSRVVFASLGLSAPADSTMVQPNAGTGGVYVQDVVRDQTPPKRMYEPDHPDADADGYVDMPNIDMVTEMTDMLAASRAYEANITTINVAKNMAQRALDIGRL
jgi:flagellar basal-body rod protein FlgC